MTIAEILKLVSPGWGCSILIRGHETHFNGHIRDVDEDAGVVILGYGSTSDESFAIRIDEIAAVTNVYIYENWLKDQ